MKKIFSYIFILFAVCSIFGLAACKDGETAIDSISISGQKTEYFVGDKLDLEGIVVTAKLSDGTETNVTADVKIDHNANMNQVGSYAIIVSYGKVSIAYQINVAENINNIALESIEVEAEGAKKLYEIGDELSTEAVTVYETYSNGSIKKAVDLAGYTIKVVNGENEEVKGAFTELGNYTVVLSKGEITDSYEIRVGAYMYENALEALEIGLANENKINFGSLSIDNGDSETYYEYLFGQNYTQIYAEIQDGYISEHLEVLENGTVFGVTYSEVYNREIYMNEEVYSPIYEPTEDNMLGFDFSSSIGYYDSTLRGVTAFLTYLQEIAVAETSLNYQQGFANYCEICGYHHAYSFSFEYISNDYYYNYMKVIFELNQDRAIESYQIERNVYYLDSMIFDEETGLYSENPDATGYDFYTIISGEQYVGERTAVNEFGADVLAYQSFDLQDKEATKITEGQTIKAKASEEVYLAIENASPETAKPEVDEIKCSVTDENGMETWNASAYYDIESGSIKLASQHPGTYNIKIKTINVEYNLVFVVEYGELTEFKAGIYDELSWGYVEAETATIYTNTSIELSAIVNEGASKEFTATCSDTNALIEGNYFSATVAGTYEVLLTSKANSEFTATITITVEELPALEDILNGKWVFDDGYVSVTIEFTPASEGALNGTLTITEGDVVSNFTYTCDAEWLWLSIEQVEGETECMYGINLTESYTLELTMMNPMLGWAMPMGELTRPAA